MGTWKKGIRIQHKCFLQSLTDKMQTCRGIQNHALTTCVCVCVCFGMCVHVCIQMVHLIEEAASWRDGELKRNGERKGRWILLARGKGDAIKMETQGRTANR